MKLRDAFKSGKFVITAECGPAKGTDMTEFKSNIDILKGKVDAINITDQQSAVMRVGSLAGCIMLMEKGIDFRMKVLVVDDFATMRKIVRNILKQIGFEDISEAEDGNAALRVIKNEKVGLVVTDWNMPNMSGLDLLR